MLKVSKIVLSLFVVSSVALANPTKDMNSLDISKNDKEFIFGKNDVNTLALNNSEMKDTDGKFWVAVARVAGMAAARSQIKGSQDKNPNKNIKPRKKYRTYKR